MVILVSRRRITRPFIMKTRLLIALSLLSLSLVRCTRSRLIHGSPVTDS